MFPTIRSKGLGQRMFADSPLLFSKPTVNTLFDDDEEEMSLSDVLTPTAEAKHAAPTRLTSNNEPKSFKIRKRLFKQCKSFDDSILRGSPSFGQAKEKIVYEKPFVPSLNFENDKVMTTLEDMAINENLVGDGTIVHKLPTIAGKHRDLKCITPQTLFNLINGAYKDVINNHVVIDCRYPYEYTGGHITGAKNLYTKDLIDSIFENISTYEGTVLVFHCEFSSERGPKLLRYLRRRDREINADRYPELFFPEVYLLNGGYKEFYQNHEECCNPQDYIPMLKKEHSEELRFFRIKSKSWNGEERRRCLRFGMEETS